MKSLTENYVPQTALKSIKKQAWTVWSATLILAFVWIFLILLAPISEANNFFSISNPLYTFFSYVCHQIPSRSFHLENHAFAVCSRCFGIYFGLLIGFFIYLFLRPVEDTEPLPRFWLFAAMIPMAVDWSLGVFEIWENTSLSRLATGLILGAVCAIFIIPALIEIFRLLSNKRH